MGLFADRRDRPPFLEALIYSLLTFVFLLPQSLSPDSRIADVGDHQHSDVAQILGRRSPALGRL